MISIKEIASNIKILREIKKQSTGIEGVDFKLMSKLEAYQIQNQVIDLLGREVVGWKLGGTNEHTRQKFNVSELYWGPVFKKDLLESNNEAVGLNVSNFFCGEVECAIFLKRVPVSAEEIHSQFNLKDYVSHLSLSLELPWSSFKSVDNLGVASLISDLCATGNAIISNPVLLEDFEMSNFVANISVNKEFIQQADLSNLSYDLASVLKEFFMLSLEQGVKLREGQWIFTGGLTSCVRLSLGDYVEVDCKGFNTIKLNVRD